MTLTVSAGEDRWLCTLLLKQGWRVEYNAASDAHTNAPEDFKEFYNQVIPGDSKPDAAQFRLALSVRRQLLGPQGERALRHKSKGGNGRQLVKQAQDSPSGGC